MRLEVTVRHTGWANVLPLQEGERSPCAVRPPLPCPPSPPRTKRITGVPHGPGPAPCRCGLPTLQELGALPTGVSGTVRAGVAQTRPPRVRSSVPRRARAGQMRPETGPRRVSCSSGRWTVRPHPHVRPTFASAQGGTRVRKRNEPPRSRSAERRFKGTGDSRLAKRTVLRESPLTRSLSGAWMLHHHSPRRADWAVTAIHRCPVDPRCFAIRERKK